MKTFLSFYLMVVLCITVSAQGPPPQYLTGGEMYYTYLGMVNGEHVYRLSIQFYADCGNAAHPSSVPVSIFERLTNVLIKRISAPLIYRSTENLKPDLLNDCVVNQSSLCNVLAYYSLDISLPGSPNGYLLSCMPGSGYRTVNLENLSEKGYVYATYTAEIPASNAAVNSTFRITSEDLITTCANSKFFYSFRPADDDGDELRFYLCGAYQAGLNVDNYVDPVAPPPFKPVIYGANFSSSMPLGANVIVDERSGLMTGIAPKAGHYVVTICVGEYRNGKLIATQRKEIQVNITSCQIATASLLPEYMVCGDNRTLKLANLSSPFRVEQFFWQISSSDGTVLYTQTTPTISYTFADTGIYKIKLVINRDNACRDSTTSIARVYPGLKADFSFSGTCINNPTSFINNSTVTFGQLDYWKWNFGDDVFGSAAQNILDVTGRFSPTYQYQSSGSKTAQLIVGTTLGCRDTLRKKINIIPKSQITMVTLRDILICVGDTVELKAHAPGGGNFTWSPQVSMVNSNSQTPKVSPPVTTVYHVLLDDNVCQNTDSVKVRVTDKVFLRTMNDTTICQGDSIQLKLVSDAFTYSWTNVSPARSFLPNPITVTNSTTVYVVTASIGGCSAKDSVRVVTVPYPIVNAGADMAICNEGSTQLMGSTDGSSFAWSFEPTLSQTDLLHPIALPKITTSYVLTAFGNRGCPKSSSDTVIVKVLPPIKASAGRDTIAVIGQPLQLNATGGIAYQWSPAATLSATNVDNPVASHNSPSEGIRYKVTVFNAAGCADTAYVTVKVFATKPQIFVPSAFTPNGDGRNDKVGPIAAGVQIEYFNIYNRWGQLVFTTKTDRRTWDGTVGGKIQNTGVFTWIVKAIDYTGKPYLQKGLITLIR